MAGLAVRKATGIPRPPLPTAKAVRKIFETFNTWAYKREQPSDAALLASVVEQAVLADSPLPFVLYWGKGPRNHIAAPDETCLDYLAGMADRIRIEHPAGASFELLLTDTHARLNRHGEAEIASYYREIDAAAVRRGYRTRLLSDVAATAAQSMTDGHDAAAIDPELLGLLTKSASKWYGGDGAARFGAIEYYAMNMREKRAVEDQYPHAIFLTFNDSRFRPLFPDRLPVFYMYSLRKGVGVKPWFMSGDAGGRDGELGGGE